MIKSTRIQTAEAVLNGMSTLQVSETAKVLAPEFTHQVLPASLNMPPRDLEAYKLHAGRVGSIFSEFKVVPQMIFEDEERSVVVIYAKMIGELIKLGHWKNECFMMMKMNANGTKVVEMKEFVDSAKATLLYEKLSGLDKGNVMREGEGRKGSNWNLPVLQSSLFLALVVYIIMTYKIIQF